MAFPSYLFIKFDMNNLNMCTLLLFLHNSKNALLSGLSGYLFFVVHSTNYSSAQLKWFLEMSRLLDWLAVL